MLAITVSIESTGNKLDPNLILHIVSEEVTRHEILNQDNKPKKKESALHTKGKSKKSNIKCSNPKCKDLDTKLKTVIQKVEGRKVKHCGRRNLKRIEAMRRPKVLWRPA
jgi:hypothetical protein